MFKNRLIKNYKTRYSWIHQNKIEAYRIYEKDMPEFPYIIDVYKNFCLVFEKGIKDIDPVIQKENHETIQNAINEVLDIETSHVIFKTRNQQKGLAQYEKLGEKDNFFTIEENGVKYLVNLFDYLDTGIFLDHRPLRKQLPLKTQGKNLLNVYCYTGSMSLACAKNGAKTFNVDLSNTYINWAQKNFTLNEIPLKDHTFLADDVDDYLNNFKTKHRDFFDAIFCDPPTFSNSKKMKANFIIQNDHNGLIHSLMRLLKNSGTLYFSTNFRDFKMDEQLKNSFEIRNITPSSIPLDFRDKKIHYCFEVRHKN